MPHSLLRKRFARGIDKELLEHLVPRAVNEALQQAGLRPVHRPVIKDVSLKPGKPLQFTAAFEVRPAIEPRDYKGVVLHPPERQVEPSDVDQELQAMREAAAQYLPVEPARSRGATSRWSIRRAAGPRDAEQDGVLIEVGGEEFHPEFARALEGMSPGDEKRFTVIYAEDDPESAGARDLGRVPGQGQGSEAEVAPRPRRRVRQGHRPVRLARRARRRSRPTSSSGWRRERRRQLERQLSETLAAPLAIEVPQALIEHELDRRIEEQARMLLQRGVDPRTAPIDWRGARERQRDDATLKVKWELLLDAIADREGIAVGAEELEERLRQIAEDAGRSVEWVRSKLEKDGRMEEIRSRCPARKVD